jgi:ParB family chromosome partitioning protein
MAASAEPLAFECPIRQITVGARRRELRPLQELKGSIQEIGLLNPITLATAPGGYRLVAGYHRLEACRDLGWTNIPAVVVTLDKLRTELAEIDENIIRNEGSALERMEEMKRRKEIYEALHPATKHGGDRGNQHTGGKPRQVADSATCLPSFAADTAAKTGASERAVRENVQAVTNLADDVKETIRQTPIADSKTELLQLSRMQPDSQRVIARKVADGQARSVKEAVQQRQQEVLDAAGDPDGELERAHMLSAYTKALSAARRDLLALKPEHYGPIIPTDQRIFTQNFIGDARRWLDAMEGHVGRGLRLLNKEVSRG